MAVPRSAIVLTAGLGTRLRPLTYARAKPAIPVAGIPLIRRIIEWLVRAGVVDLVLNLHHLPDTLTSVVGDGTDLGARVRYSWEPLILGSAGGPKRAFALLDEQTAFVVNGDTLTDMDLGALAAAHQQSGALVTLALVPNREPERYGGVVLDANRRVTRFVARGPDARESFHFVGVQAADARAFGQTPDNAPASTIGGVYDALLAAQPGAVQGFVCDAHFWDIGTMADYLRTSRAFAASSSAAGEQGRAVTIASTARVTHSILWDDVEVGDGCRLDECIVTDGVRIRAAEAHRRTAIVDAHGTGHRLTAPIEDDR